MTGGKILDKVTITLRNSDHTSTVDVTVDVNDSSLSRKWLSALNHLLAKSYHLEKNYCFMGFSHGDRNGQYILDQINNSISAINQAEIGYHIDDHFSMENILTTGEVGEGKPGLKLIQEKTNWLHRYFEDLQGTSGNMPIYYSRADATTRWHIRQLNLLCHEFEAWALSYRKSFTAPEWQRPSQLMCWLNAPRFVLDADDYELFGIETINRPLGGVFVGVNKAVGKHHWEVFNDEGRDSRIDELISTTMRSQTEAAGDFDIEWANNPGNFPWQQKMLQEFREWLIVNGFDPEDKTLTIGHPQVGQVNLESSFGSDNYIDIWKILNTHLDVYSIKTSDETAVFDYRWDDADYMDSQIKIIEGKQ